MRAALLFALGWLVGCSSIPDVRFEDDAGASSGGGTSGSSGETGTSGSSGQNAPTYQCPDKPPPDGEGICCDGNRLCLGCARSHCDRCERNCDRGAACCPTGGSQTNVSCSRSSSCR